MATRVTTTPPAAEQAEDRAAPRRHTGPVAFPELVWAHYLWQQEVHDHGILHGPAEEDFQRLRAEFESSHGEIENVYWCTRDASAVAITAKRPGGAVGRTLRLHPVVRYHAATHWVTRDLPEIAGLLHRCEAMSVKFTELLRHGTQQIAMEWLLAIAGHLLGFADQASPPSDEATAAMVKEGRQELADLQAYYERAGEETGRIVYFWGMMIGVAILGAIGLAAAGLLYLLDAVDWHAAGTQNLFLSYAMGAIGAVVSVLSRMAAGTKRKFHVDFEVGRPPIRRVASFRPLIGAVFALVLYLALLGDLVQLGAESGQEPLEYYAVLSFFAGFSERWVRGILSPVSQLGAEGSSAEAVPSSTKSSTSEPGGGAHGT